MSQGNEISSVLDYYILEKIILDTSIKILYGGLPGLGHAFLEVAETRLASLRAFNLVTA